MWGFYKITASMVDQPAALFGNGCFEPGMVKNTYGTGCFLYMNIGEELNIAGNGILTTVAWKIGDKVTYAYDGGVYIAGAAIQWLRDGIGVIKIIQKLMTWQIPYQVLEVYILYQHLQV